MACAITIDSIRGHVATSGQPPDELTVRGTAVDCKKVSVTVEQTYTSPHHTTPARDANVDAAGAWSVTFRAADGDFVAGTFPCGDKNKLIVTAKCVDVPECSAERTFDSVPCDDCPVITALTATPARDCNPDGTRTVTVTATVTPPPGVITVVAIEDENGVGVSAVVDPQNPVVTADLRLLPGQHQVGVTVILPENCPASQTVAVSVAPCVLCVIEWETSVGACDASGRRPVSVEARVVRDDGGPVTARLVLGLGTAAERVLDTDSSQTGTATLTNSEPMPPGDQVFDVVVTAPPVGCGASRTTVSVPPCCPAPEFDVRVGPCEADGRRDVRVRATLRRGAPGPVSGRLLQVVPTGPPVEWDTGNSATGTVTLSAERRLAPGQYRFRAEYADPATCAPGELVVQVPECRPDTTPPTAPPAPAACPWDWLRTLGLALIILGIGLMIGGACSSLWPVFLVGETLFAVGTWLIFIWLALCFSCEALRRVLLIMVMLAAMLALLLLIFFILAAIVGPFWGCLLGTAAALALVVLFMGSLYFIYDRACLAR